MPPTVLLPKLREDLMRFLLRHVRHSVTATLAPFSQVTGLRSRLHWSNSHCSGDLISTGR